MKVLSIYHDLRAKVWVSVNSLSAFASSRQPLLTSRGFVPADNLLAGDILYGRDGPDLPIESVSVDDVQQLNFHVETEGYTPYLVDGLLTASYPSYSVAPLRVQGVSGVPSMARTVTRGLAGTSRRARMTLSAVEKSPPRSHAVLPRSAAGAALRSV